MWRIQMRPVLNRTITGFCLGSLLMLSCGSTGDSGENTSTEPERAAVTDIIPEPVSAGDTEFIRAAHILITWDSASEDSVSYSEGNALRVIRGIQNDILSGRATFEEIAFNYSHCTSAPDSGRLPDFTSGGVSEELDSTITTLQPGEISGIIRTRFGYHLLKRLGS